MRLGLLSTAALLCALPLLAVDGVVMNVSTGKPQPGVAISLVQPSQDGMVPLGNVTSGAQGEFKIDKQYPPGPGLIQATFQGTTYNQIITPGMPTTGIEIKVYDSTKKAGVAKMLEHLILIEPSIENVKISETFVLGNETTTTYNDPAKGSIQFYLPDSTGGKAQVVITAPGGMPITRPPVKTTPAGFYKVDYPVKPGDTRMDVTYTVPATDKFAGKVIPSETGTHLVSPPAVTLTGDGIESAGQEPQTQAHIYNLTGLDYNVLIEGIGTLRGEAPAQGDDSGSPQIEVKTPRIYTQLPWVLGLALAILALGGVMLFRRGAV
jgi:hypothetical protein